eukprot:1952526-Amphidinium_carterae.1
MVAEGYLGRVHQKPSRCIAKPKGKYASWSAKVAQDGQANASTTWSWANPMNLAMGALEQKQLRWLLVLHQLWFGHQHTVQAASPACWPTRGWARETFRAPCSEWDRMDPESKILGCSRLTIGKKICVRGGLEGLAHMFHRTKLTKASLSRLQGEFGQARPSAARRTGRPTTCGAEQGCCLLR